MRWAASNNCQTSEALQTPGNQAFVTTYRRLLCLESPKRPQTLPPSNQVFDTPPGSCSTCLLTLL
uniref:Uncharacterized protein n=1 Tax=Arundo donax TaxID=35708 RepID=A0A0A9B8L3_ARUDO